MQCWGGHVVQCVSNVRSFGLLLCVIHLYVLNLIRNRMYREKGVDGGKDTTCVRRMIRL